MFYSDNLGQVFRNKLDFFAAAKVSSSFPPPDLPEIAFAGGILNSCHFFHFFCYLVFLVYFNYYYIMALLHLFGWGVLFDNFYLVSGFILYLFETCYSKVDVCKLNYYCWESGAIGLHTSDPPQTHNGESLIQ